MRCSLEQSKWNLETSAALSVSIQDERADPAGCKQSTIERFSLEQSKWKWNRKVESCQWTLSVERECCCSICINTIKSEIKFTYKQRRWTMTRMMEKWADKTLQRWWRESYYDSSKQVQVCLFVCCFKLQPEGTFKSRWLLVLVVLVVVTSFKLTWTTRRSPSRSSVRVPLRLVWLGRIT